MAESWKYQRIGVKFNCIMYLCKKHLGTSDVALIARMCARVKEFKRKRRSKKRHMDLTDREKRLMELLENKEYSVHTAYKVFLLARSPVVFKDIDEGLITWREGLKLHSGHTRKYSKDYALANDILEDARTLIRDLGGDLK